MIDQPSLAAAGADALAIAGLSVTYVRDDEPVQAVKELSVSVRPGEILGLVGQSGSGKSSVALAVLRLLPRSARVSGSISLGGQDLMGLTEAEMRSIRGRRIGMVFQDPYAALNPVFPISTQIIDTLRRHHPRLSKGMAAKQAGDLIESMGIPRARLGSYPHQLSGGMRQRALIAAAMAADPEFLVADEPTSDLDTISQAQILTLLRRLRDEKGVGLLLISHDLAVVSALCDKVAVMHRGVLVEYGQAARVLTSPMDPYTQTLLRLSRKERGQDGKFVIDDPSTKQDGPDVGSVRRPSPNIATGTPTRSDDGAARGGPIAAVEHVSCTYRISRGLRAATVVHAVKGVDLEVKRGEILAVVGESGSGKSTLGRLMIGLRRPTGGSVQFEGEALGAMHGAKLRRFRSRAQIVFQNPYGSLNPRMQVGDALAEVLKVWRDELPSLGRQSVDDLLGMVHLPSSYTTKYPHELSGGERQRVAIARAMAVQPSFLVADEPVSSLDGPAAARILNLLLEFRASLDLTCLFITHDLGLARVMVDRIAVMYLGEIVDLGTPERIFENPGHEYTKALIAAQLRVPTRPGTHQMVDGGESSFTEERAT